MCNIVRLCHWWTNRNVVVYFVWYKCSSNLNLFLGWNDCMMICDGYIPYWWWWTALSLMLIDVGKINSRLWNLRRLMMMTHVIIFPLRNTDVLFWFNKCLIFFLTNINFLCLNNFRLLETGEEVSMETLSNAIAQTRLKIDFGMRFVLHLVSACEDAFFGIQRSFSFFLFAPVHFSLSFFIRLHFWIIILITVGSCERLYIILVIYG